MDLRLPVPEWVSVTQWYGENVDWYPNTNGHAGIDFGTPWGTFVTATDAGVVKLAGLDNTGYGNLVKIEHDWGFSYYAHLADFRVKVGERVEAGQVLGLSGNTGRSTGPHLHFEVRRLGGNWRRDIFDPRPYLFEGAPAEPEAPVIGKVRVTAQQLALRTGPGVEYPRVDWLYCDDEVEIIEERVAQVWVRTRTGWCARVYDGEQLVETVA